MQKESLNPDHAAIEAALATLEPADLQIGRDRLLYCAGMRAAAHRARRWYRVWLLSTVGLIVAAAGLTSIFFARAEPRTLERVADAQPRKDTTAEDLTTVSGYSPIWNVDGWSAERLQKAGITVQPWKHNLQSEDPPLKWVQIAFDCSQIPANHDVVMTAWIASGENGTANAFRTVRSRAARDLVTLISAVRDDDLAISSVDIFIWRPLQHGGSEAYGCRLSLKRIMDLAYAKSANEKDGDGK